MKSLIVLLVLFVVAGVGRLLDSNVVFYAAPIMAALVSLALFVRSDRTDANKSRRD